MQSSHRPHTALAPGKSHMAAARHSCCAGRHPIRLLLLMLATIGDASGATLPFCREVNSVNHGCDAACGFAHNAEAQNCTSYIPEHLMTDHCKLVSLTARGCSLACGNRPAPDQHACNSGDDDAIHHFCAKVEHVHLGCDVQCGYEWTDYHKYHVGQNIGGKEPTAMLHSLHGRCAHSSDDAHPARPVTPYCKHVASEEVSGCCLACGFFWSEADGACEKRRPKKDEL